jgi:two-component system, response regulator PdtaR
MSSERTGVTARHNGSMTRPSPSPKYAANPPCSHQSRPADAAPSRVLRVVAANSGPAARDFYQAALTRLGHQVQVVSTGLELVEACRLLGPDLVVVATELAEQDGLTAAEIVCRERPVPVVLVGDVFEPLDVARALATGWVVGCLPRHVGQDTLGAALAFAARQFGHQCALQGEVVELKQALEDRKLIERAKGAVCRRVGLDEHVAYRAMRTVASNANRKLVDVARQVLGAEEVFHTLQEAAV